MFACPHQGTNKILCYLRLQSESSKVLTVDFSLTDSHRSQLQSQCPVAWAAQSIPYLEIQIACSISEILDINYCMLSQQTFHSKYIQICLIGGNMAFHS